MKKSFENQKNNAQKGISMKNSIKLLIATTLVFLGINIHAQEKGAELINYTPNTNFIAVKVKNAKELKAGLENHPLKKIIYNDKTKAIIEEVFQSIKNDDENEDSKEEIEMTRKMIEKLYAAVTGEMILTVSYVEGKKKEIALELTSPLGPINDVVVTLIGQVDQNLFQELIKESLAFLEKSKDKPAISKKQYETIEYYTAPSLFISVFNGTVVFSTNEDNFKKVVSAITKKTPIENGLKSNEKIYGFLNSNQNKDILFSTDYTAILKAEIAKETDGIAKLVFDQMKFDKLFQLNVSFDLDDKADCLDISLNGLDDGFLQFVTFVNNEFTPSPFVSSEVSGYTRAFFSISELKKKILDLVFKINPEFQQQYKDTLAMAKTSFQIDVEAFLDSFGEDIESFSTLNKDSTEEFVILNKLKNQSNFITNFASILNNPMVKQQLDALLTIVETKEGGNQFWALSAKTADANGKMGSYSIGSIESYAFLSIPREMAQKLISQIKKGANSKLSSLAMFNNARALYPQKVALFSYSSTKDILAKLKSDFTKSFLQGLQMGMRVENPELTNKLLALFEDIKAEDLKGNLSFGLWKETNKVNFSAKLINK